VGEFVSSKLMFLEGGAPGGQTCTGPALPASRDRARSCGQGGRFPLISLEEFVRRSPGGLPPGDASSSLTGNYRWLTLGIYPTRTPSAIAAGARDHRRSWPDPWARRLSQSVSACRS